MFGRSGHAYLVDHGRILHNIHGEYVANPVVGRTAVSLTKQEEYITPMVILK